MLAASRRASRWSTLKVRASPSFPNNRRYESFVDRPLAQDPITCLGYPFFTVEHLHTRFYPHQDDPFKVSEEFEGGSVTSTRRKSSSGGGRKSRGGGSSRKQEAPVERNGPGEVRAEAYFFVKKRQTHLAALEGDEDQSSLPPDFWSRPVANFQSLEEAQQVIVTCNTLESCVE